MSAPEAVPGGWGFAHLDRVRFGDLDAMRHLNNVAYVRLVQDVAAEQARREV